jgi:hypothetical protein
VIINDWDPAFTSKYGHQFPDSYLCFDTEFTGSDERNDLIVEIGHTMVENGKVVDKLNLVLNWYAHPDIQDTWLTYKLNNMRSIVGPNWRLTPEVVAKEGMDPLQALRFYQKLFAVWKKRDLPFVAQNGQTADERLLRGNFDRFLHKSFELPPNGYFDTGGIFKATQIWEATDGNLANFRVVMMPHRTDTLKSYFHRVIHTRIAGVKWSLPAILEHYNLIEKHNADMSQHHNAGFDSMCLHWIMEEYRSHIRPRPETDLASTEDYLSPAMFQRVFEKEMADYEQEKEQAKQHKLQGNPTAPIPATRTKPALSQSNRPRRRQRPI